VDSDDTVPAGDDHPRFAVFAKRMARFTGSGWAVFATVALVLVWMAVGFAVEFSRSWELSMVVGVPLVTLLLLIVVQHTQNHDNLAMQLKLDEIIRAHDRTEDEMMRVEDASYEHLEGLERDFKSHVEDRTKQRRAAAARPRPGPAG
jgi:low affinity Fe/Cu permease